MVKINQENIDKLFFACTGLGSLEDNKEVYLIKSTLKNHFNVDLSICECADFWSWRSNEYDASWLVIHNQKEIIEWFEKYINFKCNGDYELLED